MRVWIVGAGPIGEAYYRVLRHLGHDVAVIGRGEGTAAAFTQATGCAVATGGTERFLERSPQLAEAAIVAVSPDQLAGTTLRLVEAGVPRILVEKPGGRTLREVREVAAAAERSRTAVFVAYNRRFYGSVRRARELIAADGGVTSFAFEFTEWPHRVLAAPHAPGVLENWFFLNSTHVIDLAFHLGGRPRELAAFAARRLSWHAPGVFAGAGSAETGALFSYHADWGSAGRWRVELCTPERRLVLAPLEKLAAVPLRSVAAEPLAFDEQPDLDFKPGFLRQVEAFLADAVAPELPTIAEQAATCAWYARISPPIEREDGPA
jgi:predicted dehydrogenase